jgi:hypothetical protein
MIRKEKMIMKRPNLKLRLIALVTVAATAAVCTMIRVRAQDETHFLPVAQFGILGITRGQTARINVANVSSPDNPLLPPDPCSVTLSFVDADGVVLLNNAGQPVRREVTLQPGHSTFLQINGDNLVPRDQVRLTVRPLLTVMVSDSTIPPDPCMPTLEVINNTTGHTSLLSNGAQLTPTQTSPTGQ